jgi:hypothetical protein
MTAIFILKAPLSGKASTKSFLEVTILPLGILVPSYSGRISETGEGSRRTRYMAEIEKLREREGEGLLFVCLKKMNTTNSIT